MQRMARPVTAKIRVAILLASCVVLTSCASNTSSQSNANTTALPPVVATVNDHPISTRLYEMYLQLGQDELGLDPKTEEGRAKIDKLREGIVSELIDRTLVTQDAERRGILIPPEKMAEAEARAVEQFGGEKKYDAYLAEHRLTRDEYREVIKNEIYSQLMREELSKGLTVADEEVRNYYEAHKGEPMLQQPERVTASHILINARPNLISQQLQREKNLSGEALASAVREEMERRRKVAEELRGKAAAGGDFAALARQHSEDPSSRERDGSLGTFERNTHTRAFDDAAFALKPGAVSAVVQTEYGFHVIKVTAREAAREQTLLEATPRIRTHLLAEHEAARLTDSLKELRRKAKVRINEPFRFGALKSEFPST
ncbi:MAG: foldase protein PrsA [Acidobacteriota bacterium]|jgi:peptidyl-prolyl cis-trans isomerase C|nr:foldase protein PrsA [Acidobacteriota bacterium]